jgi:hypothetical protein
VAGIRPPFGDYNCLTCWHSWCSAAATSASGGGPTSVSPSAIDGCDLVVRLGSNPVSVAGLVAGPLRAAAPLAAWMHHQY